jgi:superfamily II DNA or RNA helicase
MPVIQIATNAVVAKILNSNKEINYVVSELLSYFVSGAEFTFSYTSGSWNGRSSFFNVVSGTFPAGFVPFVQKQLQNDGFEVQIVRKPIPLPQGPENPIVDHFGNDNPDYAYQMKALQQVERHHRGIIQVATGGGKSKIAKLIMARYNRMTLFLTTRGVLLHQMKDAVEKDMRQKVGVIGDGEYAPVRGVNAAMVQTLVARLKTPDLTDEFHQIVKNNEKQALGLTRADMLVMAKKSFDEKELWRNRTIKLLQMFEVVIGEEAHEAGGNSYYEILKHCKNAHVRVALTATPFMRPDMEDNMRLMAAFGEKLIVVTEKMLIDRGILATPHFKFMDCEPHPTLRKTSPWQRAYKFGIIEAPARNKAIIDHAVKATEYGLPTLILVQRKEHGKQLEHEISKLGVSCRFIRGETDMDERKRSLVSLGNGNLQVLIGTTVLDVGVDVPAVGMVILAGGGKAEVALRQRIGRGLRSKKNMPNHCFILDFNDAGNMHLRDHAKTRRTIIEDTPGFAENILPKNKDFDWSIFEKHLKACK